MFFFNISMGNHAISYTRSAKDPSWLFVKEHGLNWVVFYEKLWKCFLDVIVSML